MLNSEAAVTVLLYFILPLWLAAGLPIMSATGPRASS
jgi:hypothetical protein